MKPKNRKQHRCVTSRYRPYWIRSLVRLKYCRLMRFQQRAVQWMARQRRTWNETTNRKATQGVILNMDYGLGKTVTSLAHASTFHWNLLYICPTNVFTHVRNEITKHFGPSVSCLEAKKWDPRLFATHNITLLSYYMLARLDVKDMQSYPYTFNTCIVDELEDAIKKKAVFNIIYSCIHARFFVGLTGANRIEETMLKLVRAATRHQIFEFRQRANFDMETHMVPLSPTLKTAYERIRTDMGSQKNGLQRHKLLQDARKLVSANKTEHVLLLLSRVQHCKVLVVSEFAATLQELAKQLRHYKQSHVLFDAVHLKTQHEREVALQTFQKPTSKLNIMLAESTLIGFGLDFGFVDVMIVIDLPKELLFYRQIQGRLRRIGQHPKQLSVQHVVEIVTKDTCDFVLYNDIHNTSKYKI